jgi:hypothetical protein
MAQGLVLVRLVEAGDEVVVVGMAIARSHFF